MGFLASFEQTVSEVANRPLLPGIWKGGKGADDQKQDPKKDGKK